MHSAKCRLVLDYRNLCVAFVEAGVSVSNVLRTTLIWVVTTLVLWAWNVYNTFFIPADFSFYNHTFFSHLSFNSVEICKAYTKTILPFSSKWSAVLACLLLLICIAWYGFKHFKSFPGLLMCLLLVYTAGYAAMGGNLDVYEMDRYLSAVIPVIFFFLFFMLQDLLKGSKARGRILTTVVVLLWFSYPLLRTVNNTVAWHKRSCAQHIP